MARMRPRGTGGVATERTRGGKKKAPVVPAAGEQPAESEGKGVARGMDQKARLMVVSLMGALLFVFLVIAVLAPAPGDPEGSAQGATVLYRLLFLLVPLGIMYGLLWGDKLLRLIGR